MLYIPIILIINLFQDLKVLSQSTCNSRFSECFNCSVCGEDDSSNTCSCYWDKNIKNCYNGVAKSLTGHFYDYFQTCTDDDSKIITQKYCGQTNLYLNGDDELVINIPQNYGVYGTRNLYCEYSFKTSGKEDTYYTLEYEILSSYYTNLNKIYCYLKIIYNDETTTSGYLTNKDINRDFDNVKEIKILMYFNSGVNNIPFSLKIKKNGDKTKVALYVTIGLVIVACLLCALIIYCLSKKISENARIRQRVLLQLAMARQRGGINDRESNSNEVDVEEENRKKIETLLQTTLKQKDFNKKYGIKDGNICTICIDEFKEKKSKVSLTPCQHVFHYKCLRKWLLQNVLNPKCPNCNYNLIQDMDSLKTDNVQTIDVARRVNDNANIETQNTNDNQNLDTNGNRLISRNVNNRGRRRVSNRVAQSTNQNILENGGNSNEIQEVVVENI